MEKICEENQIYSVSELFSNRRSQYDGVYLDDDGDIVFMYPSGGGSYEIVKSRCDTHAKILSWVLHMGQKSWVTTEAIQKFILLAIQTNGLKSVWDLG